MKIYNSYIVTVAFLLLLTATILIAVGENSINFHYTIYIIEALAVTELYAYFNTRARRGLSFVSLILFAGFMITLVFQTVRMLT